MPAVGDVPVSTPEMEELTPGKEDAITALLDAICSHYNGTYPPQFMLRTSEERRILAYKYLKARDWKMTDALQMVTKAMAFRNERNADALNLFPCAFVLRGFDEEDIRLSIKEPLTERWEVPHLWYRAMNPYYVVGYHYWDKEGHPVLYDFSGSCRVKELLNSVAKVTPVGQERKDIFLSYHLYMNLVQEYLVRYADAVSVAKGGRRILGTTVVINAEGVQFNMVSSEILGILRSMFQMDQEYFPEALHRLLVINCPSVVVHIFGLVKSSLDKNTRNKIVFCNKANSVEILKKIIDVDKIPFILGGECKCSGGCIPGIDGDCYNTGVMRESTQVTEGVLIPPGKTHLVEINLEPDDQVAWNFRCTKSQGGSAVDVSFTVTFQAEKSAVSRGHSEKDSLVETQISSATTNKSASNTVPLETIISEKMKEGADCFTAEEQGILRLVWCNGESWLRSKYLQLCINGPKKHPVCCEGKE